MERSRRPLSLLCLTAVVVLGNITEAMAVDAQVTANPLKAIPRNENSSSVASLELDENLITLNEGDRRALASYPTLEELHLNNNLVTSIPAKYFSAVPHLRVLSLSKNNISSLDPEAFFDLNALTVLDLSHNLLTTLPPTLFRGLNNLQVLELKENPWNCSCPQLMTIQEMKKANVNIGGPQLICASPENQAGHDLLNATAACYPSPSNTFTTLNTQNPPTPVNRGKSFGLSTVLKVTRLSSQDNITKDQAPVLGNTWKFTVCVAALALTTSMLIMFAIKGPSWYKLYHNYRHRQLTQWRNEDDDFVSDIFSETGGDRHHQTFTFKQGNGRVEEEDEEEYFEDPYIKREDSQEGEGQVPHP